MTIPDQLEARQDIALLSDGERVALDDYERVIERGLNTFYEVGTALLDIRDKRLYREHYGTFEDYCERRWSMSRPRAYELIGAAQVVGNLSAIADIQPENEAQVRPLTQLQPDEQRVVWEVVQQTAPAGKVTAAHVKSVVNVFKEVVTTGAIDDGTGEQIAVSDVVKAAITEETYERMMRQRTYIEEKMNDANYKRDNKANRAGDEYVPQGYDACQTPPYAIDPLLPYLERDWRVWEPAAGEGLLVEAFYDSGFTSVTASDLLTGQNFFDDVLPPFDVLVTNPPYSIKYQWLERCYALGKPFALLVPVETLGSKQAQALMQQHGFELMLLDSRVDFQMPNKGWEGACAQFPVLWLCWQLLPEQVMFGSIAEGKKAFQDGA